MNDMRTPERCALFLCQRVVRILNQKIVIKGKEYVYIKEVFVNANGPCYIIYDDPESGESKKLTFEVTDIDEWTLTK